MMDFSAGYVILEGGTGTLSEFGIVWEYVCKDLIDPRPIFVVGDFWCPLVERIRGVRPKSCRHVHCVETADEIARIALDTIRRR
jgi:predicted Rossmann-fold nucleotide-binding protein